MRRGWQSLNTGPRFYLRLIRRTGWLWISTSRTTDGRPFKTKKLSVPFLYPGVPAGLTPFRGLVPLGRRNLVPILPPAHPLWGGWHFLTHWMSVKLPDNFKMREHSWPFRFHIKVYSWYFILGPKRRMRKYRHVISWIGPSIFLFPANLNNTAPSIGTFAGWGLERS